MSSDGVGATEEQATRGKARKIGGRCLASIVASMSSSVRERETLEWLVEQVVAEQPSSLEAKLVEVRVEGRRITVLGPVSSVTRSIADATTRPDGAIALQLRDDAGSLQHATVKVAGDRMQVTLHDG